jgi:hypothetical protein
MTKRINISTYFPPKLVQEIDECRETFLRNAYIESILTKVLLKKEVG